MNCVGAAGSVGVKCGGEDRFVSGEDKVKAYF